MATQTDIEIVQGQTKVFSATWSVNDAPKSLVGYTAHLQLRKKPGKFTTPPLLDLTSVGDGAPIQMEPGDVTGMARVRISGLDTATLVKAGWYSLFLVKDDDHTESVRLVFGQYTVSLSSTDNSGLYDVGVHFSPGDEPDSFHVDINTEDLSGVIAANFRRGSG